MPAPKKQPNLENALADLHGKVSDIRTEVGKAIYGQQDVIDETLITLFAGGHALLVGVPGLAKTLLVNTLSEVLGLNAKRIQCTPDLMPADILGAEVLEESESGKKSFRFIEDPVFSQLLMADEINRASPRSQSALLQAMQEKTVSVAGHTPLLPKPFHVLATQNPLEQEGTYPLPEAQLDRFMMQINVTYPDLADERTMILATTGAESPKLKSIMTGDELMDAQALLKRIPVGDKVVDSILTLVRRARPDQTDSLEIKENIAWGAGPRAGQTLLACAKVRAAMDGRLTPSIDDVVALAPAVLRHRMMTNFKARAAGHHVDELIENLIKDL
ncbi:MAG: AAA family ATPase [Magnetococcales bacterium]|nr:AAA family ATPase [Magnetococcales bacterium]